MKLMSTSFFDTEMSYLEKLSRQRPKLEHLYYFRILPLRPNPSLKLKFQPSEPFEKEGGADSDRAAIDLRELEI